MMNRILFILLLVFSSEILLSQAEYEAIPIGKLNSPFNDFSARPYGNGILFCSNKKDDILVSYLNAETEEPLTQIYFAEQKDFGKYGSKDLLQFDQKMRIDFGPFDISPDSTLYFTKSYSGANGQTLGIFISKKSGKTWSAPEPFLFNNPEKMVGHPALNIEGTRLYFAANFDDTRGKADIYYCDLKNGEWQSPVNLAEANSPESELFPYVHADGSLYIASGRVGGKGGLDIYHVNIIEDRVISTDLLAEPFNSETNDFGLTFSPDRSTGYFTSNRDGTDDLFEFRLTKPDFQACDTLQKNSYCYVFSDDANIFLDTLPLKYEWDLGDGTRIQELEVEHCYTAPGNYDVALNIVDTLTGDLFFSQANYYLEVEDIEQVYIEAPDTVSVGTSVKLHGLNTYLPGFEPDSYHWYFSDGSYLEGPEIEYVFNTTGAHIVQLGLRSTPDAKGLREEACITKTIQVEEGGNYNLTASVDGTAAAAQPENDSESPGIFEYLETSQKDTITLQNALPEETIFRVEIKKSKERLSTLDRFFDDVRGTYDVFENFIPADSIFSYAIGQETALGNTYPIYSYVKSLDYKSASVKAYLPDFVYNLDDMDLINEADLNRAVFRTGSIYFETDKAELKPEVHNTLNKILHMMQKYPTLQIEVGAHTDDVGNSAYNLKLSKARATSVIGYFVKNGIDPSRLIGVGYGSVVPIGDNKTEEGRQENRRVEFKVVSTH